MAGAARVNSALAASSCWALVLRISRLVVLFFS